VLVYLQGRASSGKNGQFPDFAPVGFDTLKSNLRKKTEYQGKVEVEPAEQLVLR
jgi:hypothetical protein